MKLTIRHVYDFGADAERVGPDLVRPDAWDALRETPGPFELPATREDWERKAETPELAARARDVAALAARLGATRVCSYGAGNAGLELLLSRAAPDLLITCTDFTPRTVARLAALFPEADVIGHDLVTDPPLRADLHVMHRIDTELGNTAWRDVLARYREPVLFVPGLVLTFPVLLKELARRLRRPRAARAGYFRTRDALRSLWAQTHREERLAVGSLEAFLLKRR